MQGKAYKGNQLARFTVEALLRGVLFHKKELKDKGGVGCWLRHCLLPLLILLSLTIHAAESRYMVVDLSVGPDASMYYVSYLDSEPTGGWTDEYKTKKIVLRYIEPGMFSMGSPLGEVGRGIDETQHCVTLTKGYYLGVFEVTQKQYSLVMGGNPSTYTGDKRPVTDVSYNDIRGPQTSTSSYHAGTGWPGNSSVDGSSFIGKLRAKTGLANFDLPTEAQWEYAGRSGTISALNNGQNLTCIDRDENLDKAGRYGYNSGCRGACDGKGGYSANETSVGSYMANALGLYDMHGNVREWCLDWYSDSYGVLAAVDPGGPSTGDFRVARGGCWADYALNCRSASRSMFHPECGSSEVGFRLCCAEPVTGVSVKYDACGGAPSQSSMMVARGDPLGKLPVATRAGYVFLGWFTGASGGEQVTSATVVFDSAVYYAHWARSWTITYDVCFGDSTPASCSIRAGQNVGELPEVTRSGYDFQGWYTAKTGGSRVTGQTTVSSNVTYYARWTPVTASGLYCVIDLSGGPDATSYPVTYLNSVPNDKWSDEYKMTKLVLRYITPGTFTMGSPLDEIGRSNDETQHEVTLTKGYYIGVFEVTQNQYALVMGTNPSSYIGAKRAVESVSYDMIRGSSAGASWPVSGDVDSQSFLGRIRAKTGLNGIDLPTEAQWEYACRAWTTSGTQVDVGSLLPNIWGLYDMLGNVREWCLDWYTKEYGSDAVSDPVGGQLGTYRVVRGGSRTESRERYASSCESSDCGFRLACSSEHSGTEQVPTAVVTFDTEGGGSTPPTRFVVCGQTIGELPTLTRPGYWLTGWAESSNGGTPVTPETVVVSNSTYYAQWSHVSSSGLYCVVDLSGGPSASSYPITYLDTEPAGGWTDEYKSTKLVLRYIRPGTFIMGYSSGDLNGFAASYWESHAEYERPHRVNLTRGYYLGVFEVTQKQYELVMGNNPSAYRGNMRPVDCAYYNLIRGDSEGAGWPSSMSVDEVSFLGKIRARTGLAFDLPTEAQWEYACRAGTTTAYNDGSAIGSFQIGMPRNLGRYVYNSTDGYANNSGLNGRDGKGGYSSNHTTVGSYLPNAWGLYDMHGNVLEYCLDWLGQIESSTAIDPVGAASGTSRVLRGGSWSDYAVYCRSANRFGYGVGHGEGGYYGFRLCCLAAISNAEPIMLDRAVVRAGFNARGGSPAPSNREVLRGARLGELPSVKRTGYELIGWFTEEGVQVSAGTVLRENAVFYAQWRPKKYCVINLAGGTSANSYPVSFVNEEPSGGWTDEYKTTKLVLRSVNPGTFVMGSPQSESGRSEDENQHLVSLTDVYYLGVFEITQKQYELVMGDKPSYDKGDMRPVEIDSYDMLRGRSVGGMWPSSRIADASSFIGKIRAKTGLDGFDLPTEAQWEYACRAGTTTAFNSGKNLSATEVARYGYPRGTCKDWKGGYNNAHTTVGSYLPNAWGFYDMHGNVFEYCLDWYGEYGISAVTNPVGPVIGFDRVLRGGDWNSSAWGCRSAARGYLEGRDRGFRLCYSDGFHGEGQGKPVVVTFDVGVGRPKADARVYVTGETLGDFPVAAHSGYQLSGWFTSKEGGTQVTSDTVILSNMTCYAQWAPEVPSPGLYCVIDLSGGTNAISYPVSVLDSVPSGGWSEEYKTTKLVLRYVQPGRFLMGSPLDENGRKENELQHEVSLTKGYYIGVFEVTQKQYDLVMGTVKSSNGAGKVPVSSVNYGMIRGEESGGGWPVSSAVDAESFIGKIRQRTGLENLDLPTEAQWEYACRAGTATAINSGKNLMGLRKDFNMDVVGRYLKSEDKTQEVGLRVPNKWGLYDMHGMLAEWCLDWYDDSYGTGNAVDPLGATTGISRVLRGGGWEAVAHECRSASRQCGDPDSVWSCDENYGFRLCYSPNSSISATVTFDANGGGGGSSFNRECCATLGTLPTPSRTGYTFMGWFTAVSGGAQVSSSTSVMLPVTYYAQWKINTYEVTFDANGGSGGTTLRCDYNTTLGTLPTATRKGGIFAGWFTQAVGGTQVTSSTIVTGAVTYYAHWWDSVLSVTDVVARPRYPWNGKVDVSFTLWYTNELEQLCVSLTAYDAGGGTNLPVRTLLADNGVINDLRLSAGRHTITWDADEDVPGVIVSDLVCEVKAREPWVNIDFKSNGGSLENSSSTAFVGCSIGALPIPTRAENYAFEGWFTESTGGTKVTESTIAAEDMTLYAHWKKIAYSVTFDANGGSGGTVWYRRSGECLGDLPPDPTRTGYRFRGWVTDLASNKLDIGVYGEWLTLPQYKYIYSDVTYYAAWVVDP